MSILIGITFDCYHIDYPSGQAATGDQFKQIGKEESFISAFYCVFPMSRRLVGPVPKH